jgi:phosphoglycerate dehydrogenase-like enzyme
MTRVLISSPRAPEEQEAMRELEAAGCELIVNLNRGRRTESEMMELVPGVDAVIAAMDPFTEPVFEVADRLRLIARTGVGYNAIDVDVATRLGVAVTIGAGTNDRAVADFAIGLLLAAARRIPQEHARVKAGAWDRPVGFDVWQKTLGILGTGRIGRQVAKRATGFEMRILAYDAVQDQAWAESMGVRYVPLDELLRESDFVTVHVPLFPETRGIIGERELRLMKPTAFIVNTARGGLIDEPALRKALIEKWIAGAALDVVEAEPPEGAHPFADLDTAVITPHLAGGTHGSVRAMSRAAIDEVLRLTRGERPLHVVNPEALENWPK